MLLTYITDLRSSVKTDSLLDVCFFQCSYLLTYDSLLIPLHCSLSILTSHASFHQTLHTSFLTAHFLHFTSHFSLSFFIAHFSLVHNHCLVFTDQFSFVPVHSSLHILNSSLLTSSVHIPYSSLLTIHCSLPTLHWFMLLTAHFSLFTSFSSLHCLLSIHYFSLFSFITTFHF